MGLFLLVSFYFLGSRLCFPGIPKARTAPRSLCPITWSSSSPRKRLFPPTPSQRPSSKSQTPSRPSNLSIYLLSILKLFQNKNAEKSQKKSKKKVKKKKKKKRLVHACYCVPLCPSHCQVSLLHLKLLISYHCAASYSCFSSFLRLKCNFGCQNCFCKLVFASKTANL